jgi:hypothetical protein
MSSAILAGVSLKEFMVTHDGGDRPASEVLSMGNAPSPATREALGCFVMLTLGAVLSVGLLICLELAVSEEGESAPGRWRTLLVWVGAPALGIGLVAYSLYGVNPFRRSRPALRQGRSLR